MPIPIARRTISLSYGANRLSKPMYATFNPSRGVSVRSGSAWTASTSPAATRSTASTEPSRSFESRCPASLSATKMTLGVRAAGPQ
jgi:hypothetical protein